MAKHRTGEGEESTAEKIARVTRIKRMATDPAERPDNSGIPAGSDLPSRDGSKRSDGKR
jgi:hypothetical protein